MAMSTASLLMLLAKEDVITLLHLQMMAVSSLVVRLPAVQTRGSNLFAHASSSPRKHTSPPGEDLDDDPVTRYQTGKMLKLGQWVYKIYPMTDIASADHAILLFNASSHANKSWLQLDAGMLLTSNSCRGLNQISTCYDNTGAT